MVGSQKHHCLLLPSQQIQQSG
uniref:Uncharacterized protein n=1 Tax=Arundo donax TaxID=35708 RepID=A0A0A9FMN6_ARUDO